MLQLDAGALAEQFDHQMGLRRGAGRGVVELAGVGLGQRDEFAERFRRHFRIEQKQQRILPHHDDRGEVALRIVRQARPRRRHDREARGHHQERMAVGRRLGGRVGADDAARGRPVVDDHRLPERLLEIGRDEPRHHVIQSAGRERDDQLDRMAGVGLRLRACRRRAPPAAQQRRQGSGGVTSWWWFASGASPHPKQPPDARHATFRRLLYPKPIRPDQAAWTTGALYLFSLQGVSVSSSPSVSSTLVLCRKPSTGALATTW